MFNGKKIENLDERVRLLTELMMENNRRLVEIKMLVIGSRSEILNNRILIEKGNRNGKNNKFKK